ncbi:phosphotransferase family protein [Streptomyces sp. NPDC058247]|uniref:phosphotransferase family protein n=1 Tax=Streptomyces sp. NPDC058247 TaxID=3346401 RepID=UPI0036E774CB
MADRRKINEESDGAAELDAAILSRWMDEKSLPGAGELAKIRSLSGGSQNELYEIRRGGSSLALRRPSRATPEQAKVLMREARLLKALAETDVPHARLLAATDDADVLDRPFYLMELVDGWSPMQGGWAAPFDTDLAARAGLARQLVDGAARMARVDWKAAGLEGFGRPDGFLDRQVDRWLSHLSGFAFRELPGLDEAAAWLRARRPAAFRPGIMHGDYQFANVMFRHGAPAELAAIIDWEMATVGDPLLDLGWILVAWPPEGDDMTRSRYLDYAGMPPREDLLEHYATVSGLDVTDVDYYVVLARFKLAIVLEASVARYAKGQADERVSRFGPMVLELMDKAAELTRTTALR